MAGNESTIQKVDASSAGKERAAVEAELASMRGAIGRLTSYSYEKKAPFLAVPRSDGIDYSSTYYKQYAESAATESRPWAKLGESLSLVAKTIESWPAGPDLRGTLKGMLDALPDALRQGSRFPQANDDLWELSKSLWYAASPMADGPAKSALYKVSFALADAASAIWHVTRAESSKGWKARRMEVKEARKYASDSIWFLEEGIKLLGAPAEALKR